MLAPLFDQTWDSLAHSATIPYGAVRRPTKNTLAGPEANHNDVIHLTGSWRRPPKARDEGASSVGVWGVKHIAPAAAVVGLVGAALIFIGAGVAMVSGQPGYWLGPTIGAVFVFLSWLISRATGWPL